MNLKELKKIQLSENPLNLHPDSKLTQLLKKMKDKGVNVIV
jgi:predicted Fe-Mo cluster-binding NifX family protein